MLIAGRPLGAATFSLLLVLGIAIVVSRVAGPNRRWLAVAVTVILTPIYHVLLVLMLVATENAPFAFDPTVILVAAFMNGILAFPIATLFGAIERRFGSMERVDW